MKKLMMSLAIMGLVTGMAWAQNNPPAPAPGGAPQDPSLVAAPPASEMVAAQESAAIVPGTGVRDSSGLEVLERIDVNEVLWGLPNLNSLKGMSIAWDGQTGQIYTAGIVSDQVLVTRPADGHPSRSISLGIQTFFNINSMVLDTAHRNLFWITAKDGAIRSIDLDKGVLRGRFDPPRSQGRSEARATPDAVVDPATGWLWVAWVGHRPLTGYSPDLGRSVTVPEAAQASKVAVHPSGNFLYVMSGGPETSGFTLSTYVPSTRAWTDLFAFSGTRTRPDRPVPPGRRQHAKGGDQLSGPPRATRESTSLGSDSLPKPPFGDIGIPRMLHTLDDGTLLLVGRTTIALSAELKVLWQTDLPSEPSGVVHAGNTIVLVFPEAGYERGDVESRVGFLDAETGSDLGTVAVRFEAKDLAVDPAGRRVFVSNGGDGSVEILDISTRMPTGRLDVASSVAGITIDPKTGNRYLLDRLGGSEIFVWKPGSHALQRLPAGRWPWELAFDPQSRELIALSHYESSLYRWNADSGERLAPVSLQLQRNTSDTMGDLDFDSETGLAAAIFPEHGEIAVADARSGKFLWSTKLDEMALGRKAGPGKASVGIDPKHKHLLVALSASSGGDTADESAKIVVYNLKSSELLQEFDLPDDAEAGGPRRKSTRSLAQLVDPERGRVFVGPDVLDLATLNRVAVLPAVNDVFWSDAHRILALVIADDQEYLLEADGKSYAVRNRWPLGKSVTMPRRCTFDAKRGVVYVAEVAAARVTAYKLP